MTLLLLLPLPPLPWLPQLPIMLLLLLLPPLTQQLQYPPQLPPPTMFPSLWLLLHQL